MAYKIQCRSCKKDTWAANIVDLLKEHTDPLGHFICANCDDTDTYIYRESTLQENGEVWERWIKGVIQIDSGIETYCPYVFLTADSEDGRPTGLHFHYYKDTRPQGGNLKHGHGPGGPPVLGINDMFTILEHLVAIRAVSADDIRDFANRLKK